MGTKVKFQPTKTKLKYDTKAGDKINFELQGYVKHNSLLKKKIKFTINTIMYLTIFSIELN